MGTTPEQIRAELDKRMKAPLTTNIARVKSVDEDKKTCVLVDEDELEFYDVRLRPIQSQNQSYLMLPKVGTHVLAIRVEDDDDWMVIASDEIEKLIWVSGNMKFTLGQEGIIETGSTRIKVTESAVLLEKGATKVEVSEKIKIANSESMASLMNDLFTAISQMVFSTSQGPTTGLVNAAQFEAIKTRFNQLLN